MSLRNFLGCGALPASASMLLLSACVSSGDMSDIKAASELAIDCRTEQALQAADRAAQSGGFAGGFCELLRVAFLRDAGRQAFVVSLLASALFIGLAWLSAEIRRQITRLSEVGAELAGDTFSAPFGSLVGQLLVAATMFALFMAPLTYVLLARIEQDFAVFG
jgi:hypothetical protein